jgi:DNA-binding transcriptional LysR family regulator
MALNLRQIEVFRAVMTTGSISGASKVLHVSQPAVSRLLSYTETRIGFALFERIKGRLYATPEAKRLFREVDQVYLGVQRVNEVASSLAERRQGSLNIVSSPSIGHMLIPQAIASLCARHADARVSFQFLNYAPLQEKLLNHQADLGIVSSAIDHPNLETRVLGRTQLVCILPAGHTLAGRANLTLADMRDYPLIGYEADSPYGRMLNQMYAAAGETYRPAIEVGSPQNACALVQAAAGLALVDGFSLHNWQAGRIVALPVAGAPVLSASLAFLRFEPLSQLAQSFIVTLRQLMRAHGFAPAPPARRGTSARRVAEAEA